MKKAHNLYWIFIVIAATIWGIDGVLLTPKYFANGFYDVKFIVFIAHFIPTIILSILFSGQYKNISKFKLSDYTFYILISLLGGCIGTFSIVKALMLSGFSKYSVVILIQKAQPIFAIILAYILLNERPKKNFYTVFLISIVCIYLLTFGLKNPMSIPRNNMRASMYSLIAAASFGANTVLSKKIANKHSFLTNTFYRFLFTTIILFVILIFSKGSLNSLTMYINNTVLIKNSLIISILGLIAIALYYKGLIGTKAIYATICELAFPIASILTEAFVLKHYMSGIQYISAGILIASILYLNIFVKK